MYKPKCVSVRERLGNGLRLVAAPFSTCRPTERQDLKTSKSQNNNKKKKLTNREKQRSRE